MAPKTGTFADDLIHGGCSDGLIALRHSSISDKHFADPNLIEQQALKVVCLRLEKPRKGSLEPRYTTRQQTCHLTITLISMFGLKRWKKSSDGSLGRIPNINITAAESIYRSLLPDEFRLVSITPAKFAKVVSCSLQVCKLDEEIEQYETLSYRWGSPDTNLQSIILEGEDYKVTQNLHKALLHLRTKDSERRIWIDALAVNQNDEKEKDLQLPLMGKIYGNAYRTIAWLGDTKETDLLAMMRYDAGKSESEIARGIARNAVGTKSFKKWSLRHSWLEFIRYEYWTRVWIVQEILLSKNVILQFRDKSLDLDAVRTWGRAVNGLLKPGYWEAHDLELRFFYGSSDKGAFNFNPNDNLGWFLQPSAHDTRHIFSYRMWALQLCPNTHCSELKDKVYGFQECFPERVKQELPANKHELDLPEIFQQVTKAFCVGTSDILCLNLVDAFERDRSQDTNAPSWVPDYTKANLVAVQRLKNVYVIYPQVGSINVSFSTNQDGRLLLHTDAIVLAQCVKQSGLMRLTVAGEDRVVNMVSHYHEAKNELMHPEERTHWFTRAFLGSRGSPSNVLDYESVMDKLQDRKVGRSDRASIERLCGKDNYLLDHLDNRVFRFNSQIPLRSTDLWDTRGSSGFGIGPPYMRPEDKVFLIPGCDLPVVLREIDNEYAVIGNAYLPDFRADWIDNMTLSHLQRSAITESVSIR